MMSSVREQIIAEIVTTLGAVTVAGGYNNDLSGRVSRRLKHWEEVSEWPQVMIAGGSEGKSSLTTTYAQGDLEIIVRGYEHDAEDPGTKLNALIQDVEKALMADPTRGALANYTTPIRVDTDEGWLTPYGIFEFRFNVTYRYARGAP